ncbi:MAG: 30S ribosomal protein S13 [Candidatus Dojkabacteria bacterium]|nr:30S ribosomal protein S13 [Candidatus Dojkabacteria bacterium]
MARYVGVEIPDNKKVKVSLTYIHGIGQSLAKTVLKRASVDPEKRMSDITPAEESQLRSVLESLKLEGELRQNVFQNIKRLKDIRCYRGIRHKLGLPVRGQRTRHNAHTRKGKSLPIGGLKRKLEKT